MRMFIVFLFWWLISELELVSDLGFFMIVSFTCFSIVAIIQDLQELNRK